MFEYTLFIYYSYITYLFLNYQLSIIYLLLIYCSFFIFSFIYILIYLFIYLFIYFFIYLFIYLFIYSFIYVFIYLFTYIYLFTTIHLVKQKVLGALLLRNIQFLRDQEHCSLIQFLRDSFGDPVSVAFLHAFAQKLKILQCTKAVKKTFWCHGRAVCSPSSL